MARFVNPVDLKRNTTNRRLIVIFFGLTGILSLFFWLKGRDKTTSLLQPYKISYKIETKHVKTSSDTSRPTTELVTSLQDALQGVQGQYSLYVYRPKEDKGYGISEEIILPAASIMKVPIMTAVLREVDADNLHLTDTSSLSASDIRTGSGPIEFMAPGSKLTVEYLLKVAGQNSDNTAPVILSKLVGKEAVAKTISDLGMTSTSWDDNTVTALDLSLMWKNLYSGTILSVESRELLWKYLQDSIYEDRIPVGVPKGVVVIHKVGSDSDIWADSGIIMAPEPFVLTILNQGVDIEEAKILVPKITKLIWDFEASRSAQQQP